MEKQPAVYILASERNGTLYTGVTSDLIGRTWQHREHIVDGFTKRYRIATLVWYELHPTMEGAIVREKQIKKWNRSWKLRLRSEEHTSELQSLMRISYAVFCLQQKNKQPHHTTLKCTNNS